MKKMLAVFALLTVSTFAQAGLILHISEDISGGTRWQFSGSTTALTSGSQNSFWGFESGTLVPTAFGDGTIVSGSGFLASTSFGEAAVLATWASFHTFDGVAPMVSNISWDAGDVLSWSGDLVSTTNFSDFVPGTVSTKRINFASDDNISDFLTITVASSVSVPEPSTLAIFALGMIGLASRRLKKQS
jgi:hypothetical protein